MPNENDYCENFDINLFLINKGDTNEVWPGMVGFKVIKRKPTTAEVITFLRAKMKLPPQDIFTVTMNDRAEGFCSAGQEWDPAIEFVFFNFTFRPTQEMIDA